MKALIICAHTDDECGCAGTIARMLEEDYEVFYVAFSDIAKPLVEQGYAPDTARIECAEAMNRAEIKDWQILNYENRIFPTNRQKILDDMIRFKNNIKPDIVFVPASTDIHQDHHVIHNEGLRAFKHSIIMGYELPQNIIAAKNTAFIQLKKEHVEKKIHILSAYKSQAFRQFATPDFIWGLAKLRGAQCNTEYAEAFELIRMVL